MTDIFLPVICMMLDSICIIQHHANQIFASILHYIEDVRKLETVKSGECAALRFLL